MNSIEIRNSEINQEKITEQLQATLSQIPDALNLGATGSNYLQAHYMQENSVTSIVPSLVQFIPKAVLKEPPFASSAPVVGPLIVAVRKGWNWMSTKWYVLPIIMQQSNVNGELIMFLLKTIQQQEKQAEHIARLEARIAQLENKSSGSEKEA